MLKLMKNKKGFTLVEVIVVLVILAILAAIMIPSMTGWIKKAQDKEVLVEARSALLAAQTICSEHYAVEAADAKLLTYLTTAATGAKEISDLANVSGTITVTAVTNAQISGLTYVKGTQTCTYDGTNWTVA